MSALKDHIQESVKEAMRSKEAPRLKALRLITAAMKQKEVDERIELTDADILGILDKMIKQRRESIEQYRAGNREDLVAGETFELDIIQSFLPQPLTEAEIDQLIENAIVELNAASVQDMGKVMNAIKPLIQGRADARIVSAKVKERLS